MAAVLVLDSEPAERTFASEALRGAGHDVEAPAEGRPTAEQLAAAQVVVAELDAAVAAGLLRPDAPRRAAPLVVTSRFATFFAALGDRVAAVVTKPLAGGALVDAVNAVLAATAGAPSSRAPTSRTTAAGAAYPDAPPLDGSTDRELHAIAELVSRAIGAPIGLVALLRGDQQIFAGNHGLPPDFFLNPATPRAWSFCQHACAGQAPLVVADARAHPAFASNPVVELNLVRAYAGVPIEVQGVGAVGAVCVVSQEPRAFTGGDIAVLELGARLAGVHLADRFAQRPAPAAAGRESGAIAVGEVLDHKYLVTGRLGDGGQSSVFFARDKLTSQLVAIKVMRAAVDEALLVSEAAALSRVRHPNVVQVHGWGRTPAGRLYLVLEYVQGRTLADRLAETRATGERLSWDQALKIARELGGALATLHAAGVVHGDLKPSNVILDAALDRAVLIDFGLGMATGSSDTNPRNPRTPTGAAGGTPGYSAPEQLVKGDAPPEGEAVDVYGLGALIYAALVGVGPFERVRGSARAMAQLRGQVAAPSSIATELPASVDRVVLRALSADPARRQPSVVALVDELEKAMEGLSPVSVATRDLPAREPRSRGLAFRDYRRGVAAAAGRAEEERLFEGLPADVREAFAQATASDEFYPTAPLVVYLRAYAGDDLGKLEALGQLVSGVPLMTALTEMRVARTPEALLHVLQPLGARFHDWSRSSMRMTGSHEARVAFHMPDGFAPIMCSYFVGVARELMALTGRRGTVESVACRARGAATCELRVQWADA
jgi:serine/threonine protein kinase/GAF domain-containing protein